MCGKTEVGKRLAQKLALNFIDTDDLIEQRANCSCAEIVQREGEPFFRRLESGDHPRFTGHNSKCYRHWRRGPYVTLQAKSRCKT